MENTADDNHEQVEVDNNPEQIEKRVYDFDSPEVRQQSKLISDSSNT